MAKARRKKWIEELINRDGLICSLCKKPFLESEMITLDHKKPKSKGGSSSLNNLSLAHNYCNSVKGDYDILELPIPAPYPHY